MRRHKISDWNIWYGAFGKTDYARQMGNFVAFKGIIGLVFIVPFYMFLTAVHIGIFLISVQ